MSAKKVEILGVPFDAVTYDDVLKIAEMWIREGRSGYFTTPNPEMLVHARHDPAFLEILKNSVLALPDGIGILWAATYLASPRPRFSLLKWPHFFWSLLLLVLRPSRYRAVLPERVTGSDLMTRLIQHSQEKHWRIFLLGASPGVADAAAQTFYSRYPEALIVGTHAGNPAPEEEQGICERINATAPDLLFVAYGSPAQEFWIARNLPRLNTVKIAMGVGGAFDFVSGKIKRAPFRMRRIGLEWLWRLIQEPKRLRRIWRATVVFPCLVMRKC